MGSEDEFGRASEATVAFESALGDVVLRAYSAGAKVEGQWSLEPPVCDVPGWVITISKTDPVAGGGFEPDSIEE